MLFRGIYTDGFHSISSYLQSACLYLSVGIRSPSILTPVAEVEPGVSPHGEPVVLDGDGPGTPIGGHDEHLPVVLDVDAAQAGGGDPADGQEGESGHQEELHPAD